MEPTAAFGSGVDIRYVAETDSTNEDVKRLAREGAPEGVWVRAGHQTHGRGRAGRPWSGAADGNVYASTLVRRRTGDPAPATLALVAAVSVYDALTAFVGEGPLRIKWPNDIMAGAAKLCGMLLEGVDDAVIVGIGVNVAVAPTLPDRTTSCLRDLGASGCDAQAVTREIAERFSANVARWRTYGLAPVVRAWTERAHRPSTPLAVHLPDGTSFSGTFEALDAQGALVLRLPEGDRRTVHAGDVFLL